MKTIITLDGRPVKVKFVKKSDSWLHRTIGKLPFISKSYMTGFWTTIGSTIAVPSRAAPSGEFSKEWIAHRPIIIRHEARHARRAQRLTLPLYATLYLGPSVTLGLPLMLLSLACGWWSTLLWASVATVALAPFTAGFAVFRAWDEWTAYRESVIVRGEPEVERVAQSLWKDYLFTMPRCISRWWLRRYLPKA